MSIYVDESGGLSAGAMIMAGVEIEAAAAEQLLQRFRAVTGLHGELKGSRIDLVERALFFELLDRFGGQARVCVALERKGAPGQRPHDFDLYVALLTQLVDDWLPEAADCTGFVIDGGRYDALVLESVRRDIAHLLDTCGSATMVDSRRSPGVQIADVVANSVYNIATQSGRAERIQRIVDPFQASGLLKIGRLRKFPAPDTRSPALQGNAGHSVIIDRGTAQPS